MDVEALLLDIERGDFPAPDGGVSLWPQYQVRPGGEPAGHPDDRPDPLAPGRRQAAVLGFTAHIAVVADVDAAWLSEHLRPGQLSEAFTPPFLGALAARLSRRVSAIDLVALADPLSGAPDLALSPVTDWRHPRAQRALRYRTDVSMWATAEGVVILGRGLCGRWEVAVEVDPAFQGRGVGRRLVAAARHLVPDGRPVWAQIAPGNAASVRAFLAAGYRPVGQEALLVTH